MPTEKESSAKSTMSAVASPKNTNMVGMIIVAILLFGAGFFIGSLFQENQQLKKAAVAPAVANNQPTEPSGPTADTLAQMPKVTNDDYIRGDKGAKVVLVEYSDYECPFCSRFHPTTTQILADYDGDVALVYRHYPLPFHPNAQAAAETAECVGKVGGQDAFWKFTDAIFAENETLGGKISPEAITASVEASGANKSKVEACVTSGEMKEKVTAMSAAGGTAGVSGTPGTIVVVDGEPKELIPGALPLDQVKAIVDKYVNT